jgi:hypothetical protein
VTAAAPAAAAAHADLGSAHAVTCGVGVDAAMLAGASQQPLEGVGWQQCPVAVLVRCCAVMFQQCGAGGGCGGLQVHSSNSTFKLDGTNCGAKFLIRC